MRPKQVQVSNYIIDQRYFNKKDKTSTTLTQSTLKLTTPSTPPNVLSRQQQLLKQVSRGQLQKSGSSISNAHKGVSQTHAFPSPTIKKSKPISFIDRKTSVQDLPLGSLLSKHKPNATNFDLTGLDESENDIFETNRVQDIQKPQSRARIPNKMVQKIAYLTQKMTPIYQDRLQLIENVENKLFQELQIDDANFVTQQELKGEKLAYNEVLVDYDHQKHPIEIRPNLWNVQDVRQMEFYYFKIRTQGCSMPLSFMIKQSKEKWYYNYCYVSSFKIFVSTQNAFPTKFSCDHIFTAKGWKIKYDGLKQFQCKYIYFSFVCDHDMIIKMRYTFGEAPPQRVEKPQSIQVSKQLVHMQSDVLFEEIAEIKKRRRKKLLILHNGNVKDIVKDNASAIVNYNQESQKSFREAKQRENEEHLQYVKDKKKDIDTKEQAFKRLRNEAKEATKTMQKELHRVLTLKQKKNKLTTEWITFIRTAVLAHKICDTFHHKVEAIKQSRLMAFQVKRIMKRINRNLSEQKGFSIFDRVKFDCKAALTMFCKQVERKHQKFAIDELIPFLKARAFIYNLKDRMAITYQKIQKVRRKFEEFIIKKRNFQVLLGQLWEKYFQKAFQGLQEDDRKVMQNITNIQSEWYAFAQNESKFMRLVRDVFVKLYMSLRIKSYLKEISRYLRVKKKMVSHSPSRIQSTIAIFRQSQSILMDDNFAHKIQNEFEQVIKHDSITMVSNEEPRFFVVPHIGEIQNFIQSVYQHTYMKMPQNILQHQSSMRTIPGASPLKRQQSTLMLKSSMSSLRKK